MGRFSVDSDSEDEASISQENTLDIMRRENHSRSRPFVCGHNNGSYGHPSQPQLNQNENVIRSAYSGHDIYLSHPNDLHVMHHQRQHSNNRCSRNYWRHILLIIMLIILQLYAPPPITPFDSWMEYINHSIEGFGSTLTNLSALGYYVVSGCWNNIRQDSVTKINGIFSSKTEEHKICPIILPKGDESFRIQSIRDKMGESIVGQSNAMDLISRALADWDIPLHDAADDVNKPGKIATSSKAMKIMFSGPDGVGKFEVAKRVASLLLDACKVESIMDDDDDNNNNLPCKCKAASDEDNRVRILNLEGIDFALEGDSKENFIRQILEHIHGFNGAGAVVVIRHVEHISQDTKLELIRLLSKPSVSFAIAPPIVTKVSQTTTIWKKYISDADGQKSQNAKKQVDVRLDNCVFLLTTDIGTDKIFSGLRSYGLKDANLWDELHRAVEKDVLSHFGHVKLFNAVVPFWPLQYSDMKSILDKKLNSHHRYIIEIDESAFEYLAGPLHIDYIEMKIAATASDADVGESMVSGDNLGSIVFAERGGHDLPHDAIINAIEDRLKDDSFHHEDEFIRLSYAYDGATAATASGEESRLGYLELKLCSREETTGHVHCVNRGLITV